MPRIFFALFLRSFICFLDFSTFVARPFCKNIITSMTCHEPRNYAQKCVWLGPILDTDQMVMKWVQPSKSYPDKPVLRLILLGIINCVINQTKASRFSTSKMSPKLEYKDCIGVLDLIQTG